ncbi:MAG TPA: DUF2334 domain-containing protein [Kofleriaceae bacterium]
MLKQVSRLLVLGLVVATACQVDFDNGTAPPIRGSTGARIDRTAARQAIWNAAPGDVEALMNARKAATAAPEPDSIALTQPTARSGPAVDSTATKRTLVLYDRSGAWGALGELYATGAANLASHFGPWTAKPVGAYVCGELTSYDAMIYLGSSYDEAQPTCLYDDVLAGTRPVLWSFYNIWKLAWYAGDSWAANYGWTLPAGFDTAEYAAVTYKGRTLARYAANASGLYPPVIVDATKATVLASAVTPTGVSVPWAVRARNLTYIAELPFTYMTEEDRYLIFADLLFDALAPTTPERHRVVLRLEDISPVDDPAQLRAIADYLYAQGIPFGYGVISEYRDPLGFYTGGAPETVKLRQEPTLVAALEYMRARGGVPVMHGYTHQYKQLLNPYTAVTGDDTEFYRVIENADHTLTYTGPLPVDSIKATRDRISAARTNFRRANLPVPAIFEFPHYAASANAYRGANLEMATRWERALYFPGVLAGTTVSYQWMFGQLFPYAVRDVYGTRVLPENLGNIEPEPFYIFPMRFPADIVNAAEKNLVVRDGTAGFYFHPFFDIHYLQETVDGLRGLGYTFVSPTAL